MPKRLRLDNGRDLYGLPGLSEGDRRKVVQGNRELRFAFSIIDFCIRFGTPVYLENPSTSLLWKVPALKRRIAKSNAQLVRHDMCQSGTQWRKPLRFALFSFRKPAFGFAVCKPTNGRCNITSRPHVVLTSRDVALKANSTRFNTHLSSAYPPRLGHLLVDNLNAQTTNFP